MNVGDIVFIRKMTPFGSVKLVRCFVEELVFTPDYKLKQFGQMVSLYSVDGEYHGDWFQSELELTDERISLDVLDALRMKAYNSGFFGLQKDFENVIVAMKYAHQVKP